MAHLVERSGESDLVENFESGRMDGVAAEFAVEIFVHFEECHWDAPSRQKQREDYARGASTDNAAGGLVSTDDIRGRRRGLRRNSCAHRLATLRAKESKKTLGRIQGKLISRQRLSKNRESPAC